MAWELEGNEAQEVLALPAEEQYDYFINKVVEHKEVWGLRTPDGWVMVSAPDGGEMVPVWPHREFAAALSGIWEGAEAVMVPLEQWMATWLPGLAGDKRKVVVFLTQAGTGVVVEPDEMRADIEAEQELYG